MNELKGLLSVMVARSASDLYVNAEARPTLKIDNQFHALAGPALPRAQVDALINDLLTDEQRQQLQADKGLDFGMGFDGVGRFRVNVYFQKGSLAMVVRYIKDRIPALSELGLPDVLHDLALESRGLVLVVGATGTGKSTTLASMIDFRNTHRPGHILTVEDPIEYTHQHKQSLISQREIGIDTHSYADALRFGLREAPDVIMIGEIRDPETARQALRYAETGHLCLSTMHANNAHQAIDRMLNFFPHDEQVRVRQDLAQYLLGIVSQRRATGVDGRRVTPVELLLNSPYIAELIDSGKHEKIKDAMASGDNPNCQTFDDSLYHLITAGRISEEEGMRLADSRINLALRFKMGKAESGSRYLTPQKHWLSKSVDFSRFRTFAVQPAGAGLSRRPDLEAILKQAIESGFRDRGYALSHEKPDLLVRFGFGVGQAPEWVAPDESSELQVAEQGAGRGILVVQATTSAGKPVWHLMASRTTGQQARDQQEINVEIASLLSSLPLAQKASRARAVTG
ncbi:PilT/PilU family type 4a pilus ATPase [Simiduia agarivorans]|uniref:Bacterial type II secretion system protein E domain-containing protein n=1 Tax=Simiduia agarivorans (strain DSM 21679 / JCM 13881 / BCRC 17597 / SA1) TaxID=1117647 RepID=K4KNT6_SIMAS|nr:PilT/PilU family type 4a pilus ATPase [Simiduia agarivorans]AFV00840.1 hypothetical protein M5M_18555 [Simiduia agarivorans SA1 = DSM 21679]